MFSSVSVLLSALQLLFAFHSPGRRGGDRKCFLLVVWISSGRNEWGNEGKKKHVDDYWQYNNLLHYQFCSMMICWSGERSPVWNTHFSSGGEGDLLDLWVRNALLTLLSLLFSHDDDDDDDDYESKRRPFGVEICSLLHQRHDRSVSLIAAFFILLRASPV